ncbi:hypothetical protein Trydic_g17087 [Trypoxylus dichotomus]
MSGEKIAVVTGANKGIGYAIVKGLCEKFPGIVYLTSRDVTRGEAAIKSLKELGYNPLYHQLDIDDQTSVDNFKKHIAKVHGGLDVLVNNAGIAYSVKTTEPFGVQAEDSVRINYFGTLRVSEALLPLLRDSAKVVNITTSLGHLAKIPSEDIRKRFADPNLTVSKLNDLMNEFVEAAKEDPNIGKTWGMSAYGASKTGMSALSIVHQKMLDSETPSRNIYVNHVHPGYVATDMSNYNGVLTTEEGAVAPLYLALEDYNWKGQFVWRDCTLADWFGPKLPSVF